MAGPLPVPPKLKNPGLRWFGAGVLILTGLTLAGVIYCFNPATAGIYPVCRFHQWTGWNCPGCGMTRALYALLHGRFRAAAQDNLLVVASPFLLLLRWLWWRFNSLRTNPAAPFLPPAAAWLLLLVALVFAVLRNLPAFAFLSPPA